MPELPEVQTIVNELDSDLSGKTIKTVTVRFAGIFHGDPEKIVDVRVREVTRRAKMILISLDNGLTLAIHLKMTGQLVYAEPSEGETVSFPNPIPFAGNTLPGKSTHVILTFKDRSRLFFNDNRKFGWIKILSGEELFKIHEKHGPEPFDGTFTPEFLYKLLSSWNRAVKLLLMEPSKIAGIGNIYANEALWVAQINPLAKGRELAKEPASIKKLYDGIREVLEQGIKYHGSSASDEAFIDAHGNPGQMQKHFAVYQRAGKPCPRCGTKISSVRQGGRGTFFCPSCQR